MDKRSLSDKLYELFAFDGPAIVPTEIILEMFELEMPRLGYNEPYSVDDALIGRRYFVAPLNTFGTHSGRQIRIFSIPYEGIDIEGERYITWVRNAPGLLMPTDR